jgi:hypothetical protein
MGAMMGAVLNAPLAAMMAILELTYNPNIIFPSMLIILVACLSTRWVFKCDGLYQTLLAIHGKKSSLSDHERLLSRVGVRRALDKDVVVTAETQISISQALALLSENSRWLALTEQKLLLATGELQHLLSDKQASADTLLNLLSLPAKPYVELADHSNLYQALLNMNQANVDVAVVKTLQAPGLGVITRNAIYQFHSPQKIL